MFDYAHEFSVVMGYYNRKSQVIRTLDRFKETYGPSAGAGSDKYNYEVIIVDDNSSPEHTLDDIVANYDFPIRYIKISKEEKGGRINPCSVYNKGFRAAKGRVVVIQNPECIHVGNLFEYLKHNLGDNDYKAFSCYNCTSNELTQELLGDMSLINDPGFTQRNKVCWYNHPQARPVHYHFCAAMTNDNLKVLGGFDEAFAEGAWYDDNEIILSIEKNLRATIETVDPSKGFVVHQWHARDAESTVDKAAYAGMIQKNKELYDTYTAVHSKYDFPYPKLLHLYWDGSNFSYLNLLTVLSFNKHNRGWKINVFCPENPVKTKSWKGTEQKEEYTGKDYFDELDKIVNVNIHKVAFDKLPFAHKEASEVIKSDFFRLFVLNKYGGLWSDFDIVYTNSVEEYHYRRFIKNNNTVKNMVIYRYLWKEANRYVIPVGLFLANKNNSILTTILQNIDHFYNPDQYQCLGCSMFQFIFNKENYAQSSGVLAQMKLKELAMEDATCYLPMKWNELDSIYRDASVTASSIEFMDNVFGVHWFNGSADAKQYCNNMRLSDLKRTETAPMCLMDDLVKQYA